MIRSALPHLRLDSVLDVQAASLRAAGIEGLLLDLDCTLKDYEDDGFRTEVVAWVEGLRSADLRMCILSNGRPARVGRMAGQLGLPFVAKAFKPLPFGCLRAARALGLPPGRVAVVGDQLFADVLAGRLAGALTILVRPTTAVEPWFTRIKRPLERLVLRLFPVGPAAVLPVVVEPQPTVSRPGDVI